MGSVRSDPDGSHRIVGAFGKGQGLLLSALLEVDIGVVFVRGHSRDPLTLWMPVGRGSLRCRWRQDRQRAANIFGECQNLPCTFAHFYPLTALPSRRRALQPRTVSRPVNDATWIQRLQKVDVHVKPFGQPLLDARIAEVIHLGCLNSRRESHRRDPGILFRDDIGLNDRLILRKRLTTSGSSFIDGKTLMPRIPQTGLGYILAVVAVDYPGRGPRPIQEDLEMDDGGIRVRRPFGGFPARSPAIGALLTASG